VNVSGEIRELRNKHVRGRNESSVISRYAPMNIVGVPRSEPRVVSNVKLSDSFRTLVLKFFNIVKQIFSLREFQLEFSRLSRTEF